MGARDTTIHPLAALSNADLFDAASLGSGRFLAVLGETRESLLAGSRPEWDRYALAFEEALIDVPAADLRSFQRRIPDVFGSGRPPVPGVATQRDAYRHWTTQMGPTLWPPLRHGLREVCRGVVALEATLPEPLRVPYGLWEVNEAAFEEMPRLAGLSPARILHHEASSDRRACTYFLELTDELTREPIGPRGDSVDGQALLITLDVAERHGVDVASWLESLGLTRGAMLEDAAIRYSDASALLDRVRAALGDGSRRAMRDFAALVPGVRELAQAQPDLLSTYTLLNGPEATRRWGPLGTSTIAPMGERHLYLRFSIRAGLPGCPSFPELQAGVLESIPLHCDLPAAVARTIHVDDDATGFTFILELPTAAARSGTTVGGSAPAEAAPGFLAEAAMESRLAARATTVERLARELTARTDLQGLADVIVELVMGTLRADGVEVDVANEQGSALVPLRARGQREGIALRRTLEHGGRTIGELRLWAQTHATGDALAGLELLVPWVSMAIGNAVLAAREHARRTGIEDALREVLAAHPEPVFVLSDDGRVVPANARAQTALRQRPDETLARVATAATAADDTDFERFPVTIGERVERVILIGRRGDLSHDERIRRASSHWALSDRQLEVVMQLSRGLSNKEIAVVLGCAEVTVEKHVTAILRAAGVDSRGRLVAKMLQG